MTLPSLVSSLSLLLFSSHHHDDDAAQAHANAPTINDNDDNAVSPQFSRFNTALFHNGNGLLKYPEPVDLPIEKSLGFYCMDNRCRRLADDAVSTRTAVDSPACFRIGAESGVLPYRQLNMAQQVDYVFWFTHWSDVPDHAGFKARFPNISLAIRNEYGDDLNPFDLKMFVRDSTLEALGEGSKDDAWTPLPPDELVERAHHVQFQYRPSTRRLRVWVDNLLVIRTKIPFDIRNLFEGTYNISAGVVAQETHERFCFYGDEYLEMPVGYKWFPWR